MTDFIGKGGIMIPLWAATLMFFGTIFVALITGWFMLRGKKVDGPAAALNALIANAPALLTKAQELLADKAVLQDKLRERDGKIDDLGEQIAALTEKVGHLDDTVRTLTAQADRVPGLVAEIGGLREGNRSRDVRIELLVIERDVALRAQERAEGGYDAARQAIKDICPPAGEGDCPPFAGPEAAQGASDAKTSDAAR